MEISNCFDDVEVFSDWDIDMIDERKYIYFKLPNKVVIPLKDLFMLMQYGYRKTYSKEVIMCKKDFPLFYDTTIDTIIYGDLSHWTLYIYESNIDIISSGPFINPNINIIFNDMEKIINMFFSSKCYKALHNKDFLNGIIFHNNTVLNASYIKNEYRNFVNSKTDN
jgi:hypothetical protein